MKDIATYYSIFFTVEYWKSFLCLSHFVDGFMVSYRSYFSFFFLYIGGHIAFETWSEKSISQETFTHHCMTPETWQNNKKRNSRNWSFKKWSICFIDVANNFRILYIYLKHIESNKGGPIRRILGVLRILKFQFYNQIALCWKYFIRSILNDCNFYSTIKNYIDDKSIAWCISFKRNFPACSLICDLFILLTL